MKAGMSIAGSPRTVADFLAREAEVAGANMIMGQMVFGTLAYDDALRSLELFAGEVMPALQKEKATA